MRYCLREILPFLEEYEALKPVRTVLLSVLKLTIIVLEVDSMVAGNSVPQNLPMGFESLVVPSRTSM